MTQPGTSLSKPVDDPCSEDRTAPRDLLTSCVHCGLCLEVCPTWQLSGDENNSPRGRLRLWREEAEERIPQDPWTARYTEECVGCLACESACPANVPYGEILEQQRADHVSKGRTRINPLLRLAAALAARPRLFSAVTVPLRILRRLGFSQHRNLFPGQPSILLSTADYARTLMQKHQPSGPLAALQVGCLMESAFREINFATVRVLIENNFRVIVPEQQECCGAVQSHLGLPAPQSSANECTLARSNPDVIVTNSSGCGLALQHSLNNEVPVRDVIDLLSDVAPHQRTPQHPEAHVYIDLPCHLVHGQRVQGFSENVLNATGLPWEYAPQAADCCGSGGVYHLQQPQNATRILQEKSRFLNEAKGQPPILATSNHVCMMQWYSAGKNGLVHRPFLVKHLIQLLDPGPDFSVQKQALQPAPRPVSLQ